MRSMTVLWTGGEIAAATGGSLAGDFDARGVTFDSREVGPGDLFVAMPGSIHDGHKFVDGAFAAGASGALVSTPVAGPHVLVADTARALEDLGRAARARTEATVIGVTGSVGKTSTKEALAAALSRSCPGVVHRSVKSYNNHTGVPLSLARMPRDSRFAVLEMGMNNAGEIAALTRMVRPNVAIITAVGPAHIENLGSEEAIADAKAEIFGGLEQDGVAILPEDSSHRDRLVKAARRSAERIITFGHGDADIHALHAVRAEGGSLITAALLECEVTFTISQRGDHWVSNSLAVLAAVEAVGADIGLAGLALADLDALKGRGARHKVTVPGGEAVLIDESYNANPVSVAATLKSLATEPVNGRRIAVLGTMKELGEHSDALHASLAEPILAAKVDQLILVGEETRPLEAAITGRIPLRRVDGVDAAVDALLASIGAGDVVLVKASNSVGLARLVERVAGGAA
jgi:UDP-N-acetylmuramoyl-tripeptide--D-alanyl-D-alanine ligase